MKVAGRQDASLALGDPLGLGERLTLGAVSIAARVVPRLLVSARQAHVQVSPKSGGAATLDRAQHRRLLGA